MQRNVYFSIFVHLQGFEISSYLWDILHSSLGSLLAAPGINSTSVALKYAVPLNCSEGQCFDSNNLITYLAGTVLFSFTYPPSPHPISDTVSVNTTPTNLHVISQENFCFLSTCTQSTRVHYSCTLHSYVHKLKFICLQ